MVHHPPFNEVEASRPDFDTTSQATYTKVPQPAFKPGQGLNQLPYAGDFEPSNGSFRSIKPEDHEGSDVYKLMISAITPRPIAFCSTLNAEGKANLAPMSYFNAVGHNPPAIMISVSAGKAHSDGLKDTNHNIKQTREFCVSIISEPFLEASNYTSIDAPPDVDEWKLAGLTQRKSQLVKPPHVGESAFSMECEVMHWYDMESDEGAVTGTVIIGRVKSFHVKEFLVNPEDPMKVLTEKLRPVSRLGGITYARTTQMMEVPRPVWDQVKDTPQVKEALDRPYKTIDRDT